MVLGIVAAMAAAAQASTDHCPHVKLEYPRVTLTFPNASTVVDLIAQPAASNGRSNGVGARGTAILSIEPQAAACTAAASLRLAGIRDSAFARNRAQTTWHRGCSRSAKEDDHASRI